MLALRPIEVLIKWQSVNKKQIMSNQLTSSLFTVNSVQVVAFFHPQTFPAFDAAKAVRTVLTGFAGLFDGQMQVLPFAAEVPAELPRVILKSSDGVWTLAISPLQINCTWMNQNESNVEIDEASIFAKGAEVAFRYLSRLKLTAGRLGGIVVRFAACDDPAQKLIDHFCNESSRHSPFARSTAFEVHNHKSYSPSWDGKVFAVNSWVRCQTTSGVKTGISVLQDINTLADPAAIFRAKMLSSYFAMVPYESTVILKRYFPTSEE